MKLGFCNKKVLTYDLFFDRSHSLMIDDHLELKLENWRALHVGFKTDLTTKLHASSPNRRSEG